VPDLLVAVLLVCGLPCASLGSNARAAKLRVPAHHPTIQAAIDAAATVDEVVVAPGTYAERIDFLGKAIALPVVVGASRVATTTSASSAGEPPGRHVYWRPMSRSAIPIAAVTLAALLVSCATTSGSGGSLGPAVVQFSYDSVSPETVRIAADGNVKWVNLAPDSRGFVVFPATITTGFTCGANLHPYFQKTEAGYRSLPITPVESERVELPCPLKPGGYDYEIWVTGAGFGDTGRPEQKLRGKIVVQ
jgi:hypothetical protein